MIFICFTYLLISVLKLSAVMLAQQGVRKVLDVKFHPEGLPQLVSCSNEVSTIYDSWCNFESRFSSREGEPREGTWKLA